MVFGGDHVAQSLFFYVVFNETLSFSPIWL